MHSKNANVETPCGHNKAEMTGHLLDSPTNLKEKARGTPWSNRAATLAALGSAGYSSQAWSQTTGDEPSIKWKLIQRATFGYTPELEAEIDQRGYYNWLDDQLDHTTLAGWSDFEAELVTNYGFERLFLDPCSPEADSLICPTGGNQNQVRRELVKARIIRALYSPAQVFERIVEFWTDHLNTWHSTSGVDRVKTFEDRMAIRAHALGNLEDLLLASAKSPAMLRYLDGNVNDKVNPNENYARELLELHALGADVCYSEATIQELAKALTGWKVRLSASNGCCGEVYFNNRRHDQSEKTLDFPGCGTFVIPANSGIDELPMVINILADPAKLGSSTARFIAGKMAAAFHGPNPPARMIDNMVGAYESAYGSGTSDITAMVRELFKKRWVRRSVPLMKRPLHLLAAGLRALQVEVTDPGHENQANRLVGGFLRPAGHVPFQWPAPNGYPSSSAIPYWRGGLLQRWRFSADLAYQRLRGLAIDQLLTNLAPLSSVQEVVDFLDARLYGGWMPAGDRDLLLQHFSNFSTMSTGRKKEAVSLALAAPGYQWF